MQERRCGSTALIFACYRGNKKLVKLLLDYSDKIDLNASDYLGFTVLMSACFNGDKDIVKLLLNQADKTIDVNARDISGRTASDWAKEGLNYGARGQIVKLLLEHS